MDQIPTSDFAKGLLLFQAERKTRTAAPNNTKKQSSKRLFALCDIPSLFPTSNLSESDRFDPYSAKNGIKDSTRVGRQTTSQI